MLTPSLRGGRWAAPLEGRQTLVRPQPLSLPTQPQPRPGGGCPSVAQPQREKQKVKPEFRQFHFPRAVVTREPGKTQSQQRAHVRRALFSATGGWPLSKAGGGCTRVQPHAAQGAVLAPGLRLSPLPTRSHDGQAWVRGRVKGRCQRETAARGGNTGHSACSGRPPAVQLGLADLWGKCHRFQSKSPPTSLP